MKEHGLPVATHHCGPVSESEPAAVGSGGDDILAFTLEGDVTGRQAALFPEDATSDHADAGDVADAPVHAGGNPMVPVFRFDDVCSVLGSSQGRDPDTARRIGQALRRLRATGPSRPLMMPPSDWSDQLLRLERNFPNFSDVIRCAIRPHVALTARGLQHRMAPVLLVGPPGVGKTLFARQLSKVLGLPAALFVPMASETNGSTLAGSSVFWSNSSPGALFEYLAWGQRGQPAAANGVVVIDEIDKVGTLRYDPLGALYSLLETDTAGEFIDQAMPDVLIDASRLRFLCTANDLAGLPEPLLSRMLVFAIPAPEGDEAKRVVRAMFSELIQRLGADVKPRLPERIVAAASQFEPRRAKLLLEAAIASAIMSGRTRVNVQDWESLRGLGSDARAKSIGFY